LRALWPVQTRHISGTRLKARYFSKGAKQPFETGPAPSCVPFSEHGASALRWINAWMHHSAPAAFGGEFDAVGLGHRCGWISMHSGHLSRAKTAYRSRSRDGVQRQVSKGCDAAAAQRGRLPRLREPMRLVGANSNVASRLGREARSWRLEIRVGGTPLCKT